VGLVSAVGTGAANSVIMFFAQHWMAKVVAAGQFKTWETGTDLSLIQCVVGSSHSCLFKLVF